MTSGVTAQVEFALTAVTGAKLALRDITKTLDSTTRISEEEADRLMAFCKKMIATFGQTDPEVEDLCTAFMSLLVKSGVSEEAVWRETFG